MRAFGTWVSAVGLLTISIGVVRSEEHDRLVPAEGAVQLMLLRQHDVQDELKLSKDQVQKIDEFAARQWKTAQEAHKMGAEQGKAKFEQLGKENELFIAGTLKHDQMKRLDQISMHVAGLLWVLDPKVEKEIKLTEAQKHKIKELHKQAHKEVEEAIHSSNKEARAAKLQVLRHAQRNLLMGVLTDEQKAKWKELAGEPFKGKLHFEEMEPVGKDK
jgi:Spy/CpxP family protein refolding chaperone